MIETKLQEFRQAGWRFVVSVSGGGSAFISDYLSTPGASATFLEGLVPYSTDATDEFLGFRPESYCSEKTARLLASQARRRALALALREYERNDNEKVNDVAPFGVREFGAEIVGIGATAALASDRPKKGAHRVYCAIRTDSAIFSAQLNLSKGARTRAEEEGIAADFILSTALFAVQTLAQAQTPAYQELNAPLELATDRTLFDEDSAIVSWAAFDPLGARLLAERLTAPAQTLKRQNAPQNNATEDSAAENAKKIALNAAALRWNNGKIDLVRTANGEEYELRGGELILAEPKERALYPGSFNPPHRAHCRIARLASERLARCVEPEISARNVDKPTIDPLELARRLHALQQIMPNQGIWISNAPRYVEKAAVFPNAYFVMGTDTVLRLADPKYEGDSIERRDAVLEKLRDLGVSICVFSRKIGGELLTREQLQDALPDPLRSMCDFVSEDVFLDDVSSSEIRKNVRTN